MRLIIEVRVFVFFFILVVIADQVSCIVDN